ncbi:MAG: hypothetical protein HY905_25625 [Deltaproteobacteria bacterium]|nr:hypothetical protein [Deltaproteobacteria bacterium]
MQGRSIVVSCVACAVVAGAVGWALADEGSPASPGPTSGETLGEAETFGISVGDFEEVPACAEGVSEAGCDQSRRLARELVALDRMPSDPSQVRLRPSPQQRLEWARAAAAEQRDRVMRRIAAGFPEERVMVEPPSTTQCSRYCDMLASCNDEDPAAMHAPCMETCSRAEFGGAVRIQEVLDLDTCEHL